MHGLELAQHYFPYAIMGFGGLALLVCGIGIATQLRNIRGSRLRQRLAVSSS